MKKYSQPELEVLVLTEDIVSTSGGKNYSFGEEDLNKEAVSWWE